MPVIIPDNDTSGDVRVVLITHDIGDHLPVSGFHIIEPDFSLSFILCPGDILFVHPGIPVKDRVKRHLLFNTWGLCNQFFS